MSDDWQFIRPKVAEHWGTRRSVDCPNWEERFFVDEDEAAFSQWYGTRDYYSPGWRDNPPPGILPLPSNRGKVPPPLPSDVKGEKGKGKGKGKHERRLAGQIQARLVYLGWQRIHVQCFLW